MPKSPDRECELPTWAPVHRGCEVLMVDGKYKGMTGYFLHWSGEQSAIIQLHEREEREVRVRTTSIVKLDTKFQDLLEKSR